MSNRVLRVSESRVATLVCSLRSSASFVLEQSMNCWYFITNIRHFLTIFNLCKNVAVNYFTDLGHIGLRFHNTLQHRGFEQKHGVQIVYFDPFDSREST